ncbi:hypothetical protein FVE85_1456 [Porphyridium purpureum]|uniref:Uncharacterized protein n=1 Tax=Porphyridium purpureum TaxID=35688 RepID=A0A5J4YUX4_PORPP|nr:hypothetical protein FVE85_1456 [Porphyridium purpureum]|eukprot:POR6721..scf209_3
MRKTSLLAGAQETSKKAWAMGMIVQNGRAVALFACILGGFVAGVFIGEIWPTRALQMDVAEGVSRRGVQTHWADEKRLAVCITGQLARLELDSKITNVFSVNAQNGWTVDALILLSAESEAQFVNRRVPIVAQKDYPTDDSIEEALKSHVSRVKVVRVDQPVEPVMRAEYVAGLDKWNMEEGRRWARARGHVRQWFMQRECLMHLKEMEAQNGAPYTDFIRLREDSYVYAPLRPIPDTPGHENHSLLTPMCDAWDGVNDKAATLRREAAHSYFDGPLDFFYLFGDSKVSNWTALMRPEIVIREALNWTGVHVEKVAPLDLPVITQRLTENGRCIDTIMKMCYARFMNDSDVVKHFRRNWCT